MSTKSSDLVYHEIQALLGSYNWGISELSLSDLEIRYRKEFNGPLDYNSLGVNCIEELLDKMCGKGMVVFFEEPKTKKRYVMCSRTVKFKRSFLKLNIQELLDDRGGSILLSDFEVAYKYKYKKKLDYHSFCLKDFENLCCVLNLVVEVAHSGLVLKGGNNLRNMPTNPSKAYKEIQKIIGSAYWTSIESLLSWLDGKYLSAYKRPLDYKSLDVINIYHLVYRMRDKGMLLFFEEPKGHRRYVMSSLLLKGRRKDLERIVQEVLDENDGEIPLIDFEDSFKNKFKGQLDYYYFGLRDFNSLCEVLNLVVEGGSPQGQVVKKAKIYNLRKRKK